MHLVAITKRRIVYFLIAILGIFSLRFSPFYHLINELQTFAYLMIILAWAITLEGRIVERRLRGRFLTACALLALLFLTRAYRYNFTGDSAFLHRLIWYLYYVPLVSVPAIYFEIACIITGSERRQVFYLLRILGSVIVLLILTNDLHSLFFRVEAGISEVYTYGPLYYLYIAWFILLMVLAFILMMRYCTLSVSRNFWYVPAIPAGICTLLLAFYIAERGSPMLGGVKLYNFQEIVLFLFMGFWEACIDIGLAPSNEGYGLVFRKSSLNGAIRDRNNQVIFRNDAYPPKEKGLRERRKQIQGGEVIYYEDTSYVDLLKEELQNAKEGLQEENYIVEESNRIEEERTRYETGNRLYDRISVLLRPQLMKLKELEEGLEKETDFREDLKKMTVLGSYIKRRANLELLKEENETLSSDELVYCIRESFEYLKLMDKTCLLENKGSGKTAAEKLVLAYELFEKILEEDLEDLYACRVSIQGGEKFSFTLECDSGKDIDLSSFKEEAERLKLSLKEEMIDETKTLILEDVL